MLNQLVENIYDHRTSNSWSANLRAKRFELFTSLMTSISTQQNPINILDVGGVADFWERSGLLEIDSINIRIKTININPFYEQHGTKNLNIKTMTGDATNMHQFHDQEFDVIFSNSVIEHVGNYDAQCRMASEIMRVGKKYFIQTPNFYFPIEPHFLFLGFQFLPISIRTELLNNYKLGWMKREPDKNEARNVVESIKLLNKNQFFSLFPGANCYEEKFFGLTKSFIAYGGW